MTESCGDERWSFIDTCQRDLGALSRPDLPITVSLDGGYVVRLLPRRGRPASPRVVAQPRDPQDSTGHRDIDLGIRVVGEFTDQPIH
jgi:hypothetical protein